MFYNLSIFITIKSIGYGFLDNLHLKTTDNIRFLNKRLNLINRDMGNVPAGEAFDIQSDLFGVYTA